MGQRIEQNMVTTKNGAKTAIKAKKHIRHNTTIILRSAVGGWNESKVCVCGEDIAKGELQGLNCLSCRRFVTYEFRPFYI